MRCSKSQHRRLEQLFCMSAELYNACLESWKGTYAWWKQHHNPDVEKFPSELNMSHFDRVKMFTGVRRDHPEWNKVSVNVGRGVLARFERAVASFYKRCKEPGTKPGFPRFKPSRGWRSIEIPDPTPNMLVAPNTRDNASAKRWTLGVKGVPRVSFVDKGHRLETALNTTGRVVELRVVRTALRVEVHVVVKQPVVPIAERVPVNPVGIDKGIKDRMVFSDGRHIPARQPDMRKLKRLQRAVSRADQAQKNTTTGGETKRSNSRAKKQQALTKEWRRWSERARDHDYRLADELVNTYDGFAVENLNVQGMLRSKRFSKKIAQQRWTTFDDILGFKAWKAGILFVKVNPAYTTTDCSVCGHRQSMPLHVREYVCGGCGVVMCRDCNAARNICVRAFGKPSRLVSESGGAPPMTARNNNSGGKTCFSSGKNTATQTLQNHTPKTRQHTVAT